MSKKTHRPIAYWVTKCILSEVRETNQRIRKRTAGMKCNQDSLSPYVSLTNEAVLFSFRYFIISQIAKLRPDCVVDVGAGPLALLCGDLRRNWIQGSGCTNIPYIGIEPDPSFELTGSETHGISFYVGGPQPLFRRDSVPCLVLSEVLEHCERKTSRKMLAECCAAVQPCGTLLITTPCADGWDPSLRGRTWERENKEWGHFFYWGWEEIRNFLTARGFTLKMWSSRMVGDRRSRKAIYQALLQRYEQASCGDWSPTCEKAVTALVDDLVDRYGQRLVKSLFAHVLPTLATHMQIQATKTEK